MNQSETATVLAALAHFAEKLLAGDAHARKCHAAISDGGVDPLTAQGIANLVTRLAAGDKEQFEREVNGVKIHGRTEHRHSLPGGGETISYGYPLVAKRAGRVVLQLDLAAIFKKLGEKALRNTTRRAVMIGGAVIARGYEVVDLTVTEEQPR